MSGPFVTPKAKGYVRPQFARGVLIDARAADSEIDGDIVLHLPDPPDQRRAGPKQTDIPFVKDFGDRADSSVIRTFDDRAEKVVGVLLAGQRNLGV